MRLETLALREWRVFAALDLEFSDGLIGVRGPNGVGKTTLAEAIGWALFGKLRGRARVADLRRQGAADGARSSVTLTWRVGDVRYRVERVVGGSARLWIDGTLETSQTTATNLRIAQELNMTWDLFCRTVYARQKDVAALDPGATGEARRAHVERLLGLGRVREAAAKAREEHKRLKASLEGMRAAAVDVSELRARLDAASRRAMDTPAVAAADAAAGVGPGGVRRRAPGGGGRGGARDAACGPRGARGVVDGRGGRGRGAAGGRAPAWRGAPGGGRDGASGSSRAPPARPRPRRCGGAGRRSRRPCRRSAAAVEALAGVALRRRGGCVENGRSRRRCARSWRRSSSLDGVPALEARVAALEEVAAAGPLDAASAQERAGVGSRRRRGAGGRRGRGPAGRRARAPRRRSAARTGRRARSACGRSKGRARS